MRQLRSADIDQARQARWRSALLLITDRCPVGCAHCSVDARAGGPGIRDWALFDQVLDAVCGTPGFALVAVTGGEPFVERRGLTLAADRIHAAGKRLVVYTSGLWGAQAHLPAWIRPVLARCSCVVLSTDAFHAARIPAAAFVGAARAVADQGGWLISQVLDDPPQLAAAVDLLTAAFGTGWADFAEVRPVPLLRYGRAATLSTPDTAGAPDAAPVRGADFGRCGLVDAPVIRYDGRLAGCCNENVLGGAGPARLHRAATSRDGIRDALAELHADPLLQLLGRIGVGPLTGLPGLTDLAAQPFRHICQPCWLMLARGGDRTDAAARALAAVRSQS